MAEYIFFSILHGTFIEMDHILRHKTYFNEFKIMKIIHCIVLNNNRIKPEINNEKIPGKSSNISILFTTF